MKRYSSSLVVMTLSWFSLFVHPLFGCGKVSEVAALPSQQSTYTIVELGIQGAESEATAINNTGQVAGTNILIAPETTHDFVYSNGKRIDLGTLGGKTSNCYGINDKGQIVGVSQLSGGKGRHAYLYSAGKMTDLLVNGGKTDSEAHAINDKGEIAGYFERADGVKRGFLWSNGKSVDIGTLGGSSCQVITLNNRSEILGVSDLKGDQVSHVFLYSGGKMRDIHTLLGADCTPAAMNDKGWIVGCTGAGDFHGFLYDGKMTDLGHLGGVRTVANGINNQGDVVGYSTGPGGLGDSRAFFYQKSKMVDLNTLIPSGSGWKLSEAKDINDKGQIVGKGYLNGKQRGFLLTPTSPSAG